MEYKFFCDENITKKLQKTIQEIGFQVNSVRQEQLYGMSNGNLVKYIEAHGYTLLTFDKDFLQHQFVVSQGILILDVNPNYDEFTVPILKKFLLLLQKGEISCVGKKILLNQEFILKAPKNI